MDAGGRLGVSWLAYCGCIVLGFMSIGPIAGTPKDISCDPMFIACPCGQSPTSSSALAAVRVPLWTCYDGEQGDGNSSCVPCDGQTVTTLCSGYEQCATCGQGLDRCLTCPQQKYGKWCDKVCNCLNDGICNPSNGSCVCSKIFTGKRCELPVQEASMENDVHHSHMVRRQISPSTTVSCPVLPAPSNGEIHTEATAPTLNDDVKYTCHENFTMIGSSARHCLRSGQWAGEAPTCQKLCAYPVLDTNVNVAINPERPGEPHLTTLGVEILAELLFSCNPGFVLIGSPRMRCASGVWDQVVPKCVHDPECADPGDPKNGERFVLRGVVKASYKIGTQLSFNCTESDYTLVGSANITCMPFSQWSAPKPRCVPNVISDCVYECQAISASILNVAERPLVCSLESDTDTHVLLRPNVDGTGNP